MMPVVVLDRDDRWVEVPTWAELAAVSSRLDQVEAATQTVAGSVTREGYTVSEQDAYCANYCAGEHHPECALRGVEA